MESMGRVRFCWKSSSRSLLPELPIFSQKDAHWLRYSSYKQWRSQWSNIIQVDPTCWFQNPRNACTPMLGWNQAENHHPNLEEIATVLGNQNDSKWLASSLSHSQCQQGLQCLAPNKTSQDSGQLNNCWPKRPNTPGRPWAESGSHPLLWIAGDQHYLSELLNTE